MTWVWHRRVCWLLECERVLHRPRCQAKKGQSSVKNSKGMVIREMEYVYLGSFGAKPSDFQHKT